MLNNQVSGRWCHLLALFVVAHFGQALASEGLSIGAAITAPQHGVVALDAHAALPLVRFAAVEAPLLLAARADVSAPLDFSAAPALGVSALLAADEGRLRPYLGAGVGISFVSGGSGAMFSSYAYTGLSYRFAGPWSALLEGSVNLSSAGINPGLSLGISYTFGVGE